jgi:hypothetical protein
MSYVLCELCEPLHTSLPLPAVSSSTCPIKNAAHPRRISCQVTSHDRPHTSCIGTAPLEACRSPSAAERVSGAEL